MITYHIFAGGMADDLSFVKISDGDKIICADRGIVYAQRLGIVPDLIVGDFDSYNGELPENCEIHRSKPEKDDTDTMLALKLAIESGAESVIIYGALGGRFDHTAANIQSLKYASEHNCRACIMDSDNIIMLQERGTVKYSRRENWYFSVFAYSPRIIVTISGVKYPLDNAEVTSGFPIGVSNEITDSEAVITVSDGTALVIYSKS